MSSFANVDEYIVAQPAQTQERLRELREVVRATVPEAVEGISYGLPTYKLDGKSVAYFGAAKRHVAFYGSVPAELAEELRGYDVEKGTVRFPLDEAVPAELVRKLVVAWVAQREAAEKG